MELALDNDDLLMCILLLLPAKSLIRFKSVSKKWRSVIASDHFCRQHTLRHPKLQQSLLIQMHTEWFFYNETINGGKVMIPYRPSVRNKLILQDCNGLLLLESKHQSYYVYKSTAKRSKLNPKNSFYVYNPTTRRSREISLTGSGKFPYVAAIGLAFDPSKSPYYKVVCVRTTSFENLDSYASRVEVYNSESHTWKLNLEPSTHRRFYHKSGVYWNNSILWCTCGAGGGDGGYYCFDIVKNESKIVYLPPFAYEDIYKSSDYLQESNGHLYYIELIERPRRALVEVRVSGLGGDDCSQWLSKDRGEIHMPPHSDLDISVIRFMVRPDGDGTTGNLLTFEIELKRLMAYNFLNKSYELLVDFSDQPIHRYYEVVKGFQFGEILALV